MGDEPGDILENEEDLEHSHSHTQQPIIVDEKIKADTEQGLEEEAENLTISKHKFLTQK